MFFEGRQVTDLTLFLLGARTRVAVLDDRFELLLVAEVGRPVLRDLALLEGVALLLVAGAGQVLAGLAHEVLAVALADGPLGRTKILRLLRDAVVVGTGRDLALGVRGLVAERKEGFVHGVGGLVGAGARRLRVARGVEAAALPFSELDFGGLGPVVHGRVVRGTREMIRVVGFEAVVLAVGVTQFVGHVLLRLAAGAWHVGAVRVSVLVPELHRGVFLGQLTEIVLQPRSRAASQVFVDRVGPVGRPEFPECTR